MFEWTLPNFSKIERKIRDAAISTIRFFHADPKPTQVTVRTEFKDSTTAHLLAVSADRAGLFHTSNKANRESPESPRNPQQDHLTSTIFTMFHAHLEVHPFPTTHLNMLNTVYGLINDTHVSLEDHLSIDEFKDSLCTAIAEYLESSTEWFDNQAFISQSDFTSRSTRREIWHSNSYPTAPYRTEDNHDHPKAFEHQDMVTNIASALAHNQVPDEIVIFLLSLSVSSAGFIFHNDVNYPTYLNFMPPNWILKNRNEIWSLRMQNKFEDDSDHYEPEDVDDQKLTDIENEEFDDMKPFDFKFPLKSKRDSAASGRPPMDEDSTHAQRRKSKKERHQKPKEEGPPTGDSGSNDTSQSGQQPPPPNPTIPDDSAYQPDPNWTRREKGIISLIQSLPQMDMRRDHMTRFQTTNEQPTSIAKSQVDPRANGDIDVFFGKTKFSQHYLITFTRKSRKPIFNPIN